MRLRVTGHNGEPSFPFEDRPYWQEFKSHLELNGFQIESSNFGHNVDALICMGVGRLALREAKASNIDIRKKVLIIWEPPCVSKKLHSRKYQKKFGLIATPNVSWSKNKNLVKFSWPQESFSKETEPFHKWKNRMHGIALIQANKISFHQNEQYSLRRRILFGQHKQTFCVYGQNWNANSLKLAKFMISNFIKYPTIFRIQSHTKFYFKKLSTYMGKVSDKQLTLKQFQISLVIENSPDYLSEKLFEASIADNLVIYVGQFPKNRHLKNYYLGVRFNEKDINTAITEILNMSAMDRYSIMISQQKILKKYYRTKNAGNPMGFLADQISIFLRARN